MASTSRFKSSAILAVMSEPDFKAASTTKVPKPSAAIMRLRLGKLCANAAVSSKYSLMIKPCKAMSCASV